MKKISVILFLSSLSIIASAQLQKGNLLLGGGFGFQFSQFKPTDSSITSDNKFSYGQLNPRIGWFVNNHSAVGLEPGYEFTKQKTADPPYLQMGDFTSSRFSIMPFYRYYFPIGEKAAFFLNSKAGVTFGNTKHNSVLMNDAGELVPSSGKSTTVSGSAYISPGIALFISSKFSIEMMISSLSYEYTVNKPQEGENNSDDEFNFNANFFTFGTTWYFAKK